MAKSAKKTGSQSPESGDRARLLNRLVFGLALLGMLLAVHLWIQSERGFSYGCFGLDDPAEVDVVECEAVVQSSAGKLFGISNIVYGFFFFGTLAALSFVSILSKGEATGKLRKTSLIVASVGFLYALYLFSYQVFFLGQFCQLCLLTGLTTATIFGVHAVEWAGGAAPRFELAELVREVGLFLLMIMIAAMLLVAELLFLNRLGTLQDVAAMDPAPAMPPAAAVQPSPEVQTDSSDEGQSAEDESEAAQSGPQAAGTDGDEGAEVAVSQSAEDAELKARLDEMCLFDETMAAVPNYEALAQNAPYIGSSSADVIMVEFFDPNCPHCRTLHASTPAIMAEVGDQARLHYRPYPIWPYSYMQVEALYLADDQDKFEEMLTAQMDRQKRGGLSVEEVVDIAESIGMDEDQFRTDLNGGKYRSRVNRERVQIANLGLRGVPKMMVNGRFVETRSANPVCLAHLVEKVEMGG